MNIKNLKLAVKRTKTTSVWIEKQIRETDDIEALRVLATSDKVSANTLEELWISAADYGVTLAIAGNVRSSKELLSDIFFDILDNRWNQTWTDVQCEDLFMVLLDNPHTPFEVGEAYKDFIESILY